MIYPQNFFVSMANLNIDGFAIRQLDAKLSLSRGEDGTVQLNIHPIYRKPQWHPLLSDDEEKALIAGEKHVVSKEHEIGGNKKKNIGDTALPIIPVKSVIHT